MIYQNPLELTFDDIFIENHDLLINSNLYIKLEGFSIGSSIKIKPALKMINRLEIEDKIRPGSRIIESSSGNLGIALSIICAAKNYEFICVVDPNILPTSENLMRAYGTKIIKVSNKDKNGGFLNTRINKIKLLCKENPDLVWINQYENLDNIDAHYLTTGPSIAKHFPKLDYLFIGAGTTGTLGGISQYISKHMPNTQIIAVDSVGSVTFNGKPGVRKIPGLGASQEPPISRYSMFDEIIRVPEEDTLKMCLRLAKKGLLIGGSSGTVLAGVEAFKSSIPEGSIVVAISPDFGERYVDTIYNSEWVSNNFLSITSKNNKCKSTLLKDVKDTIHEYSVI